MITLIILSLISLSYQVEHCLIHHKICKECEDGYYVIKKDPTSQYCMKIPHCLTYGNKEETCYWCEEGYKLSEDKTKCEVDTSYIHIDHCIESDNYNRCTRCEYGYAVLDEKCSKFDNCEKLIDETKCGTCYFPYYRLTKEGQCVFDYCLKRSNDDFDGRCRECDDYFFVNETGQCEYIKMKYCRYIERGRCIEWSDFFDVYGTYGDVVERKKFYESGCIRHDGQYNCLECDPRYHYDEETQTCNFNCKVYDENAPCEYCEYGYILTDNGKKCLQVIEIEDEKTIENSEENTDGISGRNDGENSGEKSRENSEENTNLNSRKNDTENLEKNYGEYIYLNLMVNIISIIFLLIYD